jgi:hypothetical protein
MSAHTLLPVIWFPVAYAYVLMPPFSPIGSDAMYVALDASSP